MKKRIITLFLTLCLILALMPATQAEAASAKGIDIVNLAKEYIGKVPYVWGGTKIDGSDPGADCSGFVCRIFEKFGFDLWANRTQLRKCGTNMGTDLNEAKLGDIIWYEGHVAIYAGRNSKGEHMVVQETGEPINNVVYSKANSVASELKGIIRIPGVTNDGSELTPFTPQVSFSVATDSGYINKEFISDTNAAVVTKVTKPSGVKVTQMGLYLYDASGNQIKRYAKNISDVSNSTTTYHYCFDINADLGITLTPGTSYRYKFFGVFDGVEAAGSVRRFTTTGSPGTPETPGNGDSGDTVYYTVLHYLDDGDKVFNLTDIDTFSADPGSKVTAPVRTYEGFKTPEKQTVTVAPDGSTQVLYYYEREEPPEEKPEGKPEEPPSEKPDEKPPEEKPDEKPEDPPEENPPQEEPPKENPDDKPDEKPGENPNDKPDEKPGENPNEKPGETPEKPDEKPNENPNENPKPGNTGLDNFTESNYYYTGMFRDVKSTDWFADNVAMSYRLGLMKGTGEGAFDPGKNISIAETITLAARLHSIYYTGEENFVTYDGGNWYDPYVDYARKNGIISTNYDYGQFATRELFVRILAQALPSDALEPIKSAVSFADAGSILNKLDVGLLSRAGVIAGIEDGGKLYFQPNNTITRMEVAAIVTRMAKPELRVR